MHPQAFTKWQEIMKEHGPHHTPDMKPLEVLDVGSFDLNGTLRPLIEGLGWNYTGLDLVMGDNVDIVSLKPNRFPISSRTYDLVISNATIEHVERPWLWVPELFRITQVGGRVMIMNPTVMPYHAREISNEAVDCYRILKDGMRVLMNDAGLEHVHTDQDEIYCWGIGQA